MSAPPSALDQSRSEREQEAFEDTSDFANYFCTYAFLYHQKQMLEDQRRMSAYFDAIMQNRPLFQDKVVLDVGAGSGILSIWAAKAGARKVYGVEATQVAQHARELVRRNGLEGVVEIIQSEMEKVEIPVKVDIIISEWMGYFLLRESMLDSVIFARDKFLKPGGSLYPSSARMFIAPIFTDDGESKATQCQETITEWKAFVKATRRKYDVDMDCLTPAFQKEQTQFYMQTAQWVDLQGTEMVGKPCCIKEIDLNTARVADYSSITSPFSCPIAADMPISGFAGWFTTSFEGSPDAPARQPAVVLDTAPGAGFTHWGQQSFSFAPCLQAGRGDVISGTIEVVRRKDNQRLLNVMMTYGIKKIHNDRVVVAPATATWQIP